MAEQVTFAAQHRTVLGKGVRQLRKQGIIPGNIVISGHDSIPIQLSGAEFQRFLAKNHATTVLRLTLDGDAKSDTVMVQRVEHEPVTRAVLHVDFQHVNMTETMHARVTIHFDGEAPGVKIHNAMLLTLLDHVEVEALPASLPQALIVDVSGLTEPNMTLYVRDIAAQRGVKILTDADEAVVRLEPPRLTEEATTVVAESTPASTAPSAETPEA